MSKSKPSVAIVGSGYWGKNLVRNYQKLGALRMICDRDQRTLDTFKAQYPDIDTCLDFDDVIKADNVDGVVIATPAETHYDLAMKAITAGKHVYVEKPLVLNNSDGETLIEKALKRKLTLMVGHLLQYHPVFIKLKELVREGALGRINYIYSNRLNLGKIRREENILWSFAPHDISMILSLAGEMPEYVVATGGNFLHKKIADVTTSFLEFPSGLRAHIFVSWLHPFKEQKLVVVGDRKMAVFNDTKAWNDKLYLYPHEIVWEDNIPIPAKAEPERVTVGENEPLRLECEQFLKCISTGEPPVTDGNEGLSVLKILNASQESLNENGKKILFPNQDESPRKPLSKETEKKATPPVFVHDTSIIENGCEIGQGTKIWHFSHLLPGTMLGENCNIGQNVVIGPDVNIGNGCKIQNNVSIYKGVTLEDDVFCGPSMVFTNVYNPRAFIKRMDEAKSTRVKKGATLGANCTIVCGITIGKYAFVGAGAVVLKNVEDYALVVGNPAKQVGWMCECGERLSDKMLCRICKKRYQKKGKRIVPNA